ncbi:hypothetical protein QJQ45_011289 [Haematococcus lacustris]|nr:hypothetical protein QJQ45_011289 [Haematococcus lacustris]
MNTSASQSDRVLTRQQMQQQQPQSCLSSESRSAGMVGNKYLEDALTLVGIPMRSASSLLNGDLDKRYEEVNSLVKLT